MSKMDTNNIEQSLENQEIMKSEETSDTTINMQSEKERKNEKEKKERIQIRRERIRQKYDTIPSDSSIYNHRNTNDAKNVIPPNLRSNQQISRSLSQLDMKKSTGLQNITESRVKADLEENRRRFHEENNRHELLTSLTKIEQSYIQLKEKTKDQWNKALETNDPHNLKNEIENLKMNMNDELDCKMKLINRLRHEIKSKDEEYVKTLNKNTLVVQEICECVKKELKQIENSYRIEIDVIADALNIDHQFLLKDHQKEIDELMQKKKSLESLQIERKNKNAQRFQKEVNNIHEVGNDEYNELKMKLEKDINKLEYQLEDVRSFYRMNTDKLEYDLRGINERDEEHMNIIKRQKKKYLKTKQDVSRAKEQLSLEEKKNQRRLNNIQFECSRIEKQFDMLKNQFVHFETSDKQKFEAVKTMHEEEILSLEKQVKNSSRLITQLMLGENSIELINESNHDSEEAKKNCNKNSANNTFQENRYK